MLNELWRCLNPRSHGTCHTYNDMDYDSCAACGEDRPAAVAPPSAPPEPKQTVRLPGHTYADDDWQEGTRAQHEAVSTAPTAGICECGHTKHTHYTGMGTQRCLYPGPCGCMTYRPVSPVASSATPTPEPTPIPKGAKVQLAGREFVYGMFVSADQWTERKPDGTHRYAHSKEWLDRIYEDGREIARLTAELAHYRRTDPNTPDAVRFR